MFATHSELFNPFIFPTRCRRPEIFQTIDYVEILFEISKGYTFRYSETLNNEYIERTPQMSYLLSDIGMLQIFSFLIKRLYGTL